VFGSLLLTEKEMRMKIKNIIGTLAWTVVLSACLFPAVTVASERPNIITVFIDDMGWSDLSCFGGDVVETRQIDRLAREGIKFTNFYVNSPICSPSRVALTTGQYPQRWKISSYLANRKSNNKRGMAQWLDPTAPVLARELQKVGYLTGHFGKWHMGGQRDVGDAPLVSSYGFNRSLTNFEGLGPRVLPLLDAYDGKPAKKYDLGSANLGHGPIQWKDRSVITAAFVDEALGFIDYAQKSGKPFFVNVWPDDVHSPFFPPEVLRSGTDGSKRALYYAVLAAMDEQLGVLFDRIRNDTALRNNTLIILASDNGPEHGAGKAAPLRGSKTWLYEGGVRSPLIVWGPGLLAGNSEGTVNDESILCSMDINASLYGIAGANPPVGVRLDGEKLEGTLLGHETKSRQAPIFWRRPPDRPGEGGEDNPDLAVRDGKWKFHVNYDGSAPQLYNLEADIAESNNLADTHPEVVARLMKAAFEWNESLPHDAGDPAFAPEGDLVRVGTLPPDQFTNPICEGADPWVVRDPNNPRYLWCFSDGNRGIGIHVGESLTSPGRRHVVWRAPAQGLLSQQVWAPELHFLDGRWHIYFAASDGNNKTHRAYVLRSESEDPLGEYKLHGPFDTGEDGRTPNLWAIDMTVLEHNGKRYAIWSGWDGPETDRQYLYIAPMKSPTELAGPRVRLCANDDFPWERTTPGKRGRGLNEGPQVLKAKNRTFVAYSCGASWLPTYKIGLLELTGLNPLYPRSWKKHPKPVFSSTEETFGVGHSCFVLSPDQSELWHVYHAKRDREAGWERSVFIQPMQIDKTGFPQFGTPVAAGTPLCKPSGESTSLQTALPVALPLKSESALEGWTYYGHQQFIMPSAAGIHLGIPPENGVNEYRSGEKIMFNQQLPSDLSAQVMIDFRGDAEARDAGVLFRASGAAVGYDAQCGYFAGLIPGSNRVILGKTDGDEWMELARAPVEIDAARPQSLRVSVVGDQIEISLNGKRVIQTTDAAYGSGGIGLRVVNTHAVFSNLEVDQSRP
jgi:arylsulfatase A-like enzyme/GH43 family beta-xylosidase